MKESYILMLEYDEDDQYITQQHLQEYKVPLEIVSTSEDLFAFLHNCQVNKKNLPSVVLLNYYSYPMHARDIVKALKANQHFAHIPVIVLSGTKNAEIVRESYAAGASSFIQKPALHEDTNNKIASFIDYWFHTVELK